MDTTRSLTGHLLLAMPGMTDPNFEHAVTYICEHGSAGALGIVINKPLQMDVGDVFEQLSLEAKTPLLKAQPVLRGGPVQTERGFVLHETPSKWDATTSVGHSIYVTTSQDILSDLAAGKGPSRIQMALGYAGWGAGQLEDEILHNAWLTVPASTDIVFETPYEQRWQAAVRSLGIELASLSLESGHA